MLSDSLPPAVKTISGAVAADERRDLLARLLDGGARALAEPVQARGIAVGLAQVGEHGFERRRVERRRGVVVEIDAGRGHTPLASSTSRVFSSCSGSDRPTGYWCGFTKRRMPGCRLCTCARARRWLSASEGAS